MKAQFKVTQLLGQQALVEGTDSAGATGSVVLDTREWDSIKADQAFSQATEDFEAAVEKFFKPITDAAEAANVKLNSVTPTDAAAYVVVQERVEGVQAQDEVLHHLSHDSIVLRLIEEKKVNRLKWVGDQLVVTA